MFKEKNSLSWPYFDEEEVAAVRKVLESGHVNYWTGDQGKAFEKEFSNFVGVRYSIALSNGTVALELALRSCGVGSGDEVIVTPRTFMASASSIVNVGAQPVFADVCLDSQNITLETISEVLTDKTRAIICVHLAGWPVEMEQIMRMANERGIFVIEDCAQAHGATYKNKSVGSIGHIGCWSFCQDKIISTGGEGGMVTTNNKDLWLKMWSYKDHGKSWEKVHSHPPFTSFRWLHDSFGTNFRMTEMQAAIGRIQLRKLPFWQKKRYAYCNQIWQAARETERFSAPYFACSSCEIDSDGCMGCKHAAYRSYIFVRDGGLDRDKIIEKINSRGIQCFSGSCPEVYLEGAFQKRGLEPKHRLKNAKFLGETSLAFLCHPTLQQSEVDKTCEILIDACR